MGYKEELEIIAAEEEAKKKAAEEAESAEEAIEADVAENAVESEEAESAAEPADAPAEILLEEAEENITEDAPKKKGPFIQVPVIISICIVLLALIGYFVFTAFFLRVPQGVTWSKDYDGTTYYFEFKDNNVFKAYVGSVELTSTYQNADYEGKNYLMVGADAGDFYSNQAAKYTITGSRILNNQELTISYDDSDENTFTFTQVAGREDPLTLPEGFEPDEELLGSWSFTYYGYDYCTVTFNDDGSMKIDYTQNGVTYNGTYTIQDGNVNFTYYVQDYIAQPIEYQVDGDKLIFMEMEFTRVTDEATPDEK